jgi:desampylase
MTVRISSELHQQLLAAAATSPDAEICGLLIGEDQIERIVPARNVANDPRRHFEIDPITLFAVIRAERAGGGKLLGYYHSHPSGPATPSANDAAQATSDGRIWVIIGNGEIAAWSMGEDRKFKVLDISIDG